MGLVSRVGVGLIAFSGLSWGGGAMAQPTDPVDALEPIASAPDDRTARPGDGLSATNLRWEDRGYGAYNGWWPRSYGEPRPWRPRSYPFRPYWQEPRGAWSWRQPYPRWPETRSGGAWLPRYAWPYDARRQHEYLRDWDRYRNGYRYGYGGGRRYGYGAGPPWPFDGYVARWSRLSEPR